MSMPMPEPEDQVRHYLGDVGNVEYLTDLQVLTYLTMAGGEPRLAAADALDAMAISEVLISKVIRTQDLQTDGAKVAESLRKQADRLRALVDAELDDSEDIFDVVPSNTGYRRPEHTNHEGWGM